MLTISTPTNLGDANSYGLLESMGYQRYGLSESRLYNLTASPQALPLVLSPRTVLVMACWRRRGRFDDYDDYHYLNRRSNRRHATLTGFCLFAAFLLFLLVALSLPIIKSIYLLQLDGITSSTQPTTSVGTRLRFGVWGFCATRSASYSLLEERRPGRGELI